MSVTTWLLLLSLPLLPTAALTPGEIASISRQEVCTVGYAGAHRLVTEKTKRDVYAAYGLTPAGRFHLSPAGVRVWRSDFEVDHLVSLQLGGSNAPANLWPQSYRTRRWNATAKDALENRLHWLVCVGRTLPLPDAQRVLRENWIDAYDRFITHGPPKP